MIRALFTALTSTNKQLLSIILTYKKSEKIKSRPVSRVLYPKGISIIYLGLMSPPTSCDLPLTTAFAPARAALYPEGNRDIHGLTTHQTHGCRRYRKHRWALAPPFHPYPNRSPGGYFLFRYYTLADIFPLGRMAPCVARTFLPAKGEAIERPALYS